MEALAKPSNALLAGAVGEAVGDRIALNLLLNVVVADGAGCVEGFFQVSGLKDALGSLCVVCPHAGVVVGLQLKTHRKVVVLRFTELLPRRVHLPADAEQILNMVPDFVSNCGGVLGGTLEFAGVPANRIGPIIDMPVRRWVGRFLDEAGRQGTTVRAVAEAESLARHARVAEAAAHPTLMGRVRGLGLEAYRREWIPESLMGALAPWLIARAWR